MHAAETRQADAAHEAGVALAAQEDAEAARDAAREANATAQTLATNLALEEAAALANRDDAVKNAHDAEVARDEANAKLVVITGNLESAKEARNHSEHEATVAHAAEVEAEASATEAAVAESSAIEAARFARMQAEKAQSDAADASQRRADAVLASEESVQRPAIA